LASHQRRLFAVDLPVRAAGCVGLAFLLLCTAAHSAGSAGDIDRARLLQVDRHPEEWLTSGRDFGKGHYSPLTQIDRSSVARLGLAWEYETRTERGLEATPIVVDGMMLTSGVAGRVYALDATTGKALWTFEPKVDMQVARSTCCDIVNRGVAVWKGKVYVAALDGWLYALDAGTGKVLWRQDTFIDRKRGYSSTGAPEIAGDVVVIGNAGSEYDARGYVSAYGIEDGSFKWRFFTVPGPTGQPDENPELVAAAGTWDPHGDRQAGGGGTVWDAMVYDPQLDLLYLGTGNANTYPRKVRSPHGGDNLFACSILAIRPKTGRLAWYYQEVPGDQWDYDATQPMILTRLKVAGVRHDVLIHAAKDGFLYVLDRASGKLLAAHPFVKVNWAKSVDLQTGRPVEDPQEADYGTGPKLIYPATFGGHNWNPMAYSPQSGLLYLAAIEAGNIITAIPQTRYQRGLANSGVDIQYTGLIPEGGAALPEEQRRLLHDQPDLSMHAYLRAIEPLTGKLLWQQPLPAGWWDHAGVLASAGGLVFQGTGTGDLRVFDAGSGQLLKDLEVDASIIAAPMSYEIKGVQYIAVMAAWGGGGWFMPHPESAAYRFGNEGRILAFRLDGAVPPHRSPLPPSGPIPQPPALTASAQTLGKGARLFHQMCAHCHANAPGSEAPNLLMMAPEIHSTFKQIVLGGVLVEAGMPRWDDVLSSQDTDAIHAYLISEAHADYQEQRRR
jgi:quinohemoprotein ethanol dehydrogenase